MPHNYLFIKIEIKITNINILVKMNFHSNASEHMSKTTSLQVLACWFRAMQRTPKFIMSWKNAATPCEKLHLKSRNYSTSSCVESIKLQLS